MAQADINELKNLPLQALISAPLNAIINAQAEAAMTTIAFVERVGLKRNAEESILDEDQDNQVDYDLRVAKLKIHKNSITAGATGSTETGASGNVNVTGGDLEVELPLISLFNVPTFEVSNMKWSFNAKLKSMASFAAGFRNSTDTTVTNQTNFDLKLGNFVNIGNSMKVEVVNKTDFEMRFKSGREQEYNLNIEIQANTANQPKGLTRLIDIAESFIKG